MEHPQLVTIAQARLTLTDFLNADYHLPPAGRMSPYDQLDAWAQGSLILFQRYSAVLREVAREKNVPADAVNRELAGREARIRANHLNTEVDTLIRKVLFSGTEQVSLLSIMCGMGKSMAISYLIRDVVESQACEGLLIATDSVERLQSYLNPPFDSKACPCLSNS